MKLLTAINALLFATAPLLGQELGLQQYLQRLKSAPGVTIEDKGRFLSDMGVTLSEQGLRDFIRGGSPTRTNPTSDSGNPLWSNPRKPVQAWTGDDTNWTARRRSTWSSDDTYTTPRSTNSSSNQIGSS